MTQYGVKTQPYLSFNSVVLTSHIRSDTLAQQIEGQDDTESGDTQRTEAPGLVVNSADFEFNQDFAVSGAGSVDATISAAVAARTQGAFVYRVDSGARSTTNPEWTATAFVKSYTISQGPIGSMAIARVTFGFTTALTRTASA